MFENMSMEFLQGYWWILVSLALTTGLPDVRSGRSNLTLYHRKKMKSRKS